MKDKVYCKNCFRWYITGADQCDIPFVPEKNTEYLKATGIGESLITKEQEDFARKHLNYIFYIRGSSRKIFGSPSELNSTNECPFYIGFPKILRWLTGIVRLFYS